MDQGAEEETTTPVDLELELFPCKGGCCQDFSAPTAGAHSTLMDHTVRAGWQASPVPPPLPLSPFLPVLPLYVHVCFNEHISIFKLVDKLYFKNQIQH